MIYVGINWGTGPAASSWATLRTDSVLFFTYFSLPSSLGASFLLISIPLFQSFTPLVRTCWGPTVFSPPWYCDELNPSSAWALGSFLSGRCREAGVLRVTPWGKQNVVAVPVCREEALPGEPSRQPLVVATFCSPNSGKLLDPVHVHTVGVWLAGGWPALADLPSFPGFLGARCSGSSVKEMANF